ncbi:alkylated DNA repair protein alkB-like protein 1 [Nematocida homosporus]|uniref:alkylated DNA repair protein alkB-like protein 1 n=1 Tax=Nematocida homosporus TaxID=1912981 RepID=UPI0022209ADF|nr:alkylated DNA repair protein alkB-like protein 1 [Nematocida homosporus]KAI5184315.1 alkylated DNA repair protein alkB-like protein 1 [Nematocida homosporus]
MSGHHPIRVLEKTFMHTDLPAQITKETAEQYAISKRTLHLSASTLKSEIDVYLFAGGFLYIPSPLKSVAKKQIVSSVLTQVLYPPYRNSLDRALDLTDIDLYAEFQKKTPSLAVQMLNDPVANVKLKQDPYAPPEIKEAAANGIFIIDPISLIKKIRWSSLGIYYDWERKMYDRTINNPFPEILLQACQDISTFICQVPDFVPETAVVNYYQKKDRIMSHIDRYEEDMTKPLISFSFGASCIFVLGKKEKESSEVSSFLLQDGDIAILIGDSREYLHGVPKILTENTGLSEYADEPYFPLINESRINISIRQAFKHPSPPPSKI